MNEDQAQRLGAVLKARRDELKLSTHTLAKSAGVDQATVFRLERGTFAAPAPDKLARLATALGLSAADLFALAEYTTPLDLPSLGQYLRIKYCDLPEEDLDNIEAFVVEAERRRDAERAEAVMTGDLA